MVNDAAASKGLQIAPGYRKPGNDKELMMQHSFAKQAFIDDLLARNAANLDLVQRTFAPLDRAARSAAPERDEWCVDQCMQHLVLACRIQLAYLEDVIKRDPGLDSAETFKRSWLARRSFYRKQLDPSSKTKTEVRVIPTEHFYPNVYEEFTAQKERVTRLLEQARWADLQKRCWFMGKAPINAGDYLEVMVGHDELHIDQAQRALAAYRQFATA